MAMQTSVQYVEYFITKTTTFLSFGVCIFKCHTTAGLGLGRAIDKSSEILFTRRIVTADKTCHNTQPNSTRKDEFISNQYNLQTEPFKSFSTQATHSCKQVTDL